MAWGETRLPKSWCDQECNLCHQPGCGEFQLNELCSPQKPNMADEKCRAVRKDLCLKRYARCLGDFPQLKLVTKTEKNKSQTDEQTFSDPNESDGALNYRNEVELANALERTHLVDQDQKQDQTTGEDQVELALERTHQVDDIKKRDQTTGEDQVERNGEVEAREKNGVVKESLHKHFGQEAYSRIEEELSKEVYSIQDLQYLCDRLGISDKFNEICRRNIPFYELGSLILETWATKTNLEPSFSQLKEIFKSRPVFEPLLSILEQKSQVPIPPPPPRPPPRLPPRQPLRESSPPPSLPPRTSLPERLTRRSTTSTTTTHPSRSRSPGLPPPRISLPPSSPPPLPPLPGVFEPLAQGATSASRILQVASLYHLSKYFVLKTPNRLPLLEASLFVREQLKEKRATRMIIVATRMVVVVAIRMKVITITPWMSGVS